MEVEWMAVQVAMLLESCQGRGKEVELICTCLGSLQGTNHQYQLLSTTVTWLPATFNVWKAYIQLLVTV